MIVFTVRWKSQHLVAALLLDQRSDQSDSVSHSLDRGGSVYFEEEPGRRAGGQVAHPRSRNPMSSSVDSRGMIGEVDGAADAEELRNAA
jgi:hypothetical protein